MIVSMPGSAILSYIVNATGNAAFMRFYTAPMPSAGGSVGSATLIAEVALASPVGVITEDSNYYHLTFNDSIPDSSINATGIVAWARLTSTLGDWVADFDVTQTAGNGAIKMIDVNAYIGGTFTLDSGVISVAK